VHSSSEEVMHWARAFVTTIRNVDLQDVARSRSRIQERICCVDRQTVEEAFVVGQLAVKRLESVVLFVNLPKLDRSIVDCRKSQTVLVVEFEVVAFLVVLVARGNCTLGTTFAHIPTN